MKKKKSSIKRCSGAHPALFPLHDSGRLRRAKGVHLHLAVHPGGQGGAQDLQLHLLEERLSGNDQDVKELTSMMILGRGGL